MNKGIFGHALAVFLLSTVIASPALGQDKDTTASGWKKSLVTDVTVTQTAYSDSWVGGEAGSMNWVGNVNGAAEKQLTPSVDFRSTLKLSFGQTLSQDTAGHWSKPRKSTDLIDFENVARLTKNWLVDPFAAFRLESQFVDASVEAKKRNFSPLKLTESVGLARKFYEKDNDFVTSRLGFAIRQTFATIITDSVALTTVDTMIADGGIESVTDASLNLHERVLYTGKLTLFKAVFSDNDSETNQVGADYWKAVDVNWENIVTTQVSKILAVNFYLQLLYDKEISKRARIKETVGLSFVFKLA